MKIALQLVIKAIKIIIKRRLADFSGDGSVRKVMVEESNYSLACHFLFHAKGKINYWSSRKMMPKTKRKKIYILNILCRYISYVDISLYTYVIQ